MANKIVYGDNDLYTWCINNKDIGEKLLNEYSDTVDLKTVGKGSSIKLKWKCQECGNEWYADPQHRTIGRGCPACRGNNGTLNNSRLLVNTNPELVDEWNFEANQGINIDKIAKSSNQKVSWKCKDCGHEWIASINSRTRTNSGCPKCSEGNNISIREYAIYLIISKYYKKVISQYKINNMTFDIYIDDINTVIEYQGRYFHKNVFNTYNVEERDRIKREYLKNNNIKLLTINETYGGEKISRNNDDIYFNADNKDLRYICETIINELNILLNKKMIVDDDIETQVLSMIKVKNVSESLGELYTELSKEWHTTKNGSLTPFKLKPKSNKRVWWKCSKCEYEWQTSPAHRTADNTGCPKCLALSGSGAGAHLVITGVNDLKTLRPDIADEWYTDRNNELGVEVDNVRDKSNKEVWWKCSACGYAYKDKIVYRTTRNHNCPICNGNGIDDLGSDF